MVGWRHRRWKRNRLLGSRLQLLRRQPEGLRLEPEYRPTTLGAHALNFDRLSLECQFGHGNRLPALDRVGAAGYVSSLERDRLSVTAWVSTCCKDTCLRVASNSVCSADMPRP